MGKYCFFRVMVSEPLQVDIVSCLIAKDISAAPALLSVWRLMAAAAAIHHCKQMPLPWVLKPGLAVIRCCSLSCDFLSLPFAAYWLQGWVH